MHRHPRTRFPLLLQQDVLKAMHSKASFAQNASKEQLAKLHEIERLISKFRNGRAGQLKKLQRMLSFVFSNYLVPLDVVVALTDAKIDGRAGCAYDHEYERNEAVDPPNLSVEEDCGKSSSSCSAESSDEDDEFSVDDDESSDDDDEED